MGNPGRLMFLFVLILLLGVLEGCSENNKSVKISTGSLSGKVTYQGQPLPGGNLIIKSKDKGDTVIKINANGTFEGSGIPTGQMQVAISTKVVKSWLEAGKKGPVMKFDPKDIEKIKNKKLTTEEISSVNPYQGLKYVEIPKKYNNPQESGLSVTINEGKQVKDFALE